MIVGDLPQSSTHALVLLRTTHRRTALRRAVLTGDGTCTALGDPEAFDENHDGSAPTFGA
jgi:hypothetical protein